MAASIYNEEKDNRVAELVTANEEKDNRVAELVVANEEKDNRVSELVVANEEKDNRAAELVVANEEKDNRAAELVVANEEKDNRVSELVVANEEKDNRVAELVVANEEKDNRAAELVVANEEKDNRVAELVTANEEKEKLVVKLVIANEEKEKLVAELVIAAEDKEKRAAELVIANEEKDTVARDITMRIEAEKKMRQFKSTLDLTENEVYMLWPDTLKFFYVNKAAKDQLGWSDEEFLNMTLSDIVLNIKGDETREIINLLIGGSNKSATFRTFLQRRNGDVIPVEIDAQYITPTDESPRIVAIAKDITELQKVDKAKSEFISTITHELRTPLTSIKGALGLIRTGAYDKDHNKLHSMINICYANSGRLELLIDSILKIEEFTSGEKNQKMDSTNLPLLVEESVEANTGYGDEYGVTFVYRDTDEPLMVNADKDSLMQVMANLLSNAAKFSLTGGKVEVSVGRLNEQARIIVKDSGSGIPERAQPTIFDRFTQADSSDRRAKGGTGLGLNIAKTIVDAHIGTISFISELGEGTTFYVDLPLVETESVPQANELEK
jgi:PAS domain S-box-containing protein